MPPATAETSPEELVRALEEFLERHPDATLLEDGRVLFEMASARRDIRAEHGRCLLQLWSEAGNLVRTVVGVEPRQNSLRVLVRRMGQSRPQPILLTAGRGRRAPAARSTARTRYLRLLSRVCARYFHDYKLENLRSAMDLEHSFGPAYARGVLTRGQSAWAVIGIGGEETPSSIEGILTLGILWLAHCREHSGGRRVFEGLKVFVPEGAGAVTRARMAWLNSSLAKWRLFEIGERTEEMVELDAADQGNLRMRLGHAFDPAAAIERAGTGLARVRMLLPEAMREVVETRAKSPGEVALSFHGLELARVRQEFSPGSFTRDGQITFGAGSHETPLTAESEGGFEEMARRIFESRRAGTGSGNPLYRVQPEAWLESALRKDLSVLEPGLETSVFYSQVPAFAAGDRGMLDLLTVNRAGRLAVLELKAGEDLHLPLQGLDYWIRVHWLQKQRERGLGELERSGYFPGRILSEEPPLLYFAVPALYVHPSMETVLRHFSRRVEWTLMALNTNWRAGCKTVFRRRGGGTGK